ncbi:hypothetical protein ONE63_006225 [Megalurothrips usitatus]|uniref:C2H2-type domain-containing protein n=1 Tax=Megalurothrips usitatus TaxID=439358 RepID=A0AAV7XZ40_9NEOP|nr:hypothetical protein ONE63_006225 [Megalurothrips usitatus]
MPVESVGPVPLSAWLEQIQQGQGFDHGRRVKEEGSPRSDGGGAATSPSAPSVITRHPDLGAAAAAAGGALLDVDGIINRLKSNMQFSVRRRQTEPSFDCKKCGKKYTLKNNLLRHTRLECGKEPQFPCPFCPHRSKRNDRLMQHVSSQHKEQLYCTRGGRERSPPAPR